MFKRKHLFHSILILSLLTGCGTNALAQGSPQTVTAAPATSTPTLEFPIFPSVTPVDVLPLTDLPGPETLQPTPTLPPINNSGPMIAHKAQSGDTLGILAKRFGVNLSEIISGENINLPAPGVLLQPGTLLLIPNRLPDDLSPSEITIPDSEVVFARSALDFNLTDYVVQQNGYLASYKQYLNTYGWTSGALGVEHTAIDNSLSPRMMLAIIEYQSHWVLGNPTNIAQDDYPLGYHHPFYRALFRQLMWASAELSEGYYRWRSGDLTELTFTDGTKIRMDPRLNAGTAAIQYFFSLTNNRAAWDQAVAPNGGFAALYRQMFGDPWLRANSVEPLLPIGLTQPTLTLPFEPGQLWSFSNGPHSAWQVPDGSVILVGGALAAIDFAPSANVSGCVKTDKWVVAPAAGVVVRAQYNIVMLDLDGDGLEQTGWNILFLHIDSKNSVRVGTYLQAGDRIGRPSCEGGNSTGTHVHVARKYNGEWVLADGPIPFNMDGWVVHGFDGVHSGTLVRGTKTIIACACGVFETRITRDK
jgi:murein DD-endopeptidase MepM/ murein hydrolase activator NlpD